jgi:hypothetical protein
MAICSLPVISSVPNFQQTVLNPSDGNLLPYGSMKEDPVLKSRPLALQEFAASYLALAFRQLFLRDDRM